MTQNRLLTQNTLLTKYFCWTIEFYR